MHYTHFQKRTKTWKTTQCGTVDISGVEIRCSSKRFIKCNKIRNIHTVICELCCDMMICMRSFQCEDIFIWFS